MSEGTLVFSVTGLMGSGVRTACDHLHRHHGARLVNDGPRAIDQIRAFGPGLTIVSGLDPERLDVYQAAFGLGFVSLRVSAPFELRLDRINRHREAQGEEPAGESWLDAIDERAELPPSTSSAHDIDNACEKEYFFAALHTAYWYASLDARLEAEREAAKFA